MKIQTSLGGEMSGSLGGITASHNRGGAYLRRRSIPTNPNSTRQQQIRTFFGAGVQAWTQTLTPLQRQDWRDYAAAVPRTDSLGNQYFMTGQQAFISSRTMQQLAGQTPVSAAPLVLDTGVPVTDVIPEETGVEDDGGTPRFHSSVFFGGPRGVAGDLLIFAGIPQSPGRTFYKGPYQLAAIEELDTTGDPVAPNVAMNDPDVWFNSRIYAAGEFVPLRFVAVYDDGRVSQDYRVVIELVDLTS